MIEIKQGRQTIRIHHQTVVEIEGRGAARTVVMECHESDRFSKAVGLKKALTKLLAQKPRMPKAARRAVWEAVLPVIEGYQGEDRQQQSAAAFGDGILSLMLKARSMGEDR